MAAPFVARLAERPLLGDGAMGAILRFEVVAEVLEALR